MPRSKWTGKDYEDEKKLAEADAKIPWEEKLAVARAHGNAPEEMEAALAGLANLDARLSVLESSGSKKKDKAAD